MPSPRKRHTADRSRPSRRRGTRPAPRSPGVFPDGVLQQRPPSRRRRGDESCEPIRSSRQRSRPAAAAWPRCGPWCVRPARRRDRRRRRSCVPLLDRGRWRALSRRRASPSCASRHRSRRLPDRFRPRDRQIGCPCVPSLISLRSPSIGAAVGRHRHRHRSGDTSGGWFVRGGDFSSPPVGTFRGHQWTLHLAISGDFRMATDRPTAASPSSSTIATASISPRYRL